MDLGTCKALQQTPYCFKDLRSATITISCQLLEHKQLQACTTLLLLHENKILQKPNLLAFKAVSTSASCNAALVLTGCTTGTTLENGNSLEINGFISIGNSSGFPFPDASNSDQQIPRSFKVLVCTRMLHRSSSLHA